MVAVVIPAGSGSQDSVSACSDTALRGSSSDKTALADEFAFSDADERFELLIDIFVDGLARRAAAGLAVRPTR